MRTFAQKPKAAQQTMSAKSTIPGRAHFGQSREVNSIFHLQRTIGNQAVQQLLQAKPDGLSAVSDADASGRFGHDFSQIPVRAKASVKIQSKLAVNTPGDIYEQEADRVSKHVMRMPLPQLQRSYTSNGQCPECQTQQPDQENGRLQTKRLQPNDAGESVSPPAVHEVLRSPGQPLDPASTTFFEPRFGRDFSKVQVHTDAVAVRAANAVNAKAFTVGNAIVFGAGQYSPVSNEGRRLLAHELTHVVQQVPGRLFRQKDKTVLEKEGITDARIVDDAADVQKIIQNTLSNPNSKLFPYIKNKLKNLKDGKTKYNILDPAVFARAYRRNAEKRKISIDASIKDEDLVREIGGFYDPATNTIYLKTRSNYCGAFHETIHSFSSPDFLLTWLGKDLMEGLTQFFTDVVFEEQLGDVCHTHQYGSQLRCAKKLVDTVDFDSLARLFFLNDIVKLDVIAAKLGLKDKTDLQKLRSDGICKRLKA